MTGHLEWLLYSAIRPTGYVCATRTKNGRACHMMLNDEAKALLASLPRVEDSPGVFPGTNPSTHLEEHRKCQDMLTKEAGIELIRIHDLRHSFASLCAQSSASLFLIKQLLNHAEMVTTQRYAHLTTENLRQASQSVSAAISQALTANEQQAEKA